MLDDSIPCLDEAPKIQHSLKSMSLTIGRTVNLGNYESLRIEAGVEVDVLAADADREKILIDMIQECRTGLNRAFAASNAKKG